MAYTASYDYTESVTALILIYAALRRLGVLDASEALDSAEQSDALVALNLVIKELAAEGLTATAMVNGFLFLTNKGGGAYNSGTWSMTTTHGTTTTDSAATAGDPSIEVTDTTGIVDNTIVIVHQADGSLLATTSFGAPSGNNVSLADVLTEDVDAGAYVYFYEPTTSLSNIVGLEWAANISTTADTADNVDANVTQEITIIGNEEYQRLSLKGASGTPNQIHHRKRGPLSYLYVWPLGDTNSDRVAVTVTYYVDDLDASNSNFYLPSYMFNAIVWRLAAELAAEYGISDREQAKLWAIAQAKIQTSIDFAHMGKSTTFEIGY